MSSPSTLLREIAPRRVLVLRALQLGDLLCAEPALRALRAALPGAEIVLIGLPWARAFVARFDHLLDGFLEFPGYPGLPERPSLIDRIPGFLAEVQRARFDLAIQMHGSGSVVNPLTVLLGARRCAGYYPRGGYCPDAELFLPYPDTGLEVRRNLRLMEFLGAPSRGEAIEFPIRAADREAFAALPEARELVPGGYVCVHPGASVPERRWPAERFAAVARTLAARGLRVVLTGSDAERGLTRRVAEQVAAPVLDLAGRTDLGTLAVLLEGARLLVSNDTGVVHVAAGLRVPSVILSTGDNPERWAPIDRHRHHVLCRDSGIPAAEALRHAEELLGDPTLGRVPAPERLTDRHFSTASPDAPFPPLTKGGPGGVATGKSPGARPAGDRATPPTPPWQGGDCAAGSATKRDGLSALEREGPIRGTRPRTMARESQALL